MEKMSKTYSILKCLHQTLKNDLFKSNTILTKRFYSPSAATPTIPKELQLLEVVSSNAQFLPDLNIDAADGIVVSKDEFRRDPLQECDEDLSHIIPNFPKSFNFAGYINKSESLQSLLKLGVNLHRLEKRPGVPELILKLDFEKDMKKFLFFLQDYMEPEDLGNFITKNPFIFNESIENLKIRINYLQYKRFTPPMIRRIVSHNPFWLMFSTHRIDRRLGHFQQEFQLSGQEVRILAEKQPRLITYSLFHVRTNTFEVREEMGFNETEVKTILLTRPKLFMINHLNLLRRFNYVHNIMKISHETIAQTPDVLLCREFKLRQRHSFLEKLGRAQYDPTLENYVSLKRLVEGTDIEFCNNVAKCPVDTFNLYLKTL